jgi:hypothetical protein
MRSLQDLLKLLRGLPEVANLQDAFTLLDRSIVTITEYEQLESECRRRARELKFCLDSLGIKYESAWGEHHSWSVYLATNDCTVKGAPLTGPVIADCRASQLMTSFSRI